MAILQPNGISILYSLITLVFGCSSIVTTQSCYFPSGTLAPNFTPCNGTASVSHCCTDGDACLASGLCYMTNDHSINVGSCTDKTWRDPSCFQLCPKTTGVPAYKVSNTNTLYRCNDNNWCCSIGGNTTSCCNDPGIDNDLFNVGNADISNGSAWAPGLTLAPIAAVQTSRPRSSKSAQSCPTQTVVKEINGTIPSQGEILGEKNRDDDDETKKIGLAVGFGVGAPLLVALLAAIFLLRREKHSHQLLRQQVSHGLVQPVNSVSKYEWNQPYEMHARENPGIKEMPAGGLMIQELQANQSAEMKS